MTRILTIMIISVLLICSVRADEVYDMQMEQFGADELIREIPEDIQNQLSVSESGKAADWGNGIKNILTQALQNSVGYVQDAVSASAKLILLLVLCKLPEAFGSQTSMVPSILTGALGIFLCCVNDFKTMLGLGQSVMDQMSAFSSVLLPTLTAAAVGSGSITGAGVVYAVTVFISNALIKLGNHLIIPGIYSYLALGLADTILQHDRLKKIRELVGWLIKGSLKLIVYAYTGFLSVSGVLSGAADSAALKAAKLTISGMVPIVGGIVSNAADSILTSARLLKNYIGTVGLLTIFSIFLLPFFRMGISFFMLKVVSALGGILESNQCVLLDTLGSAMAYLMALTGSCAIINILSCCSFLRMVHI